MVIGRANRRQMRSARANELFGSRSDAALDVLELLELAWHDCYGDSSPPDDVIEDVWLVSGGDLAGLICAARLAVTDYRDLRMNANSIRGR